MLVFSVGKVLDLDCDADECLGFLVVLGWASSLSIRERSITSAVFHSVDMI